MPPTIILSSRRWKARETGNTGGYDWFTRLNESHNALLGGGVRVRVCAVAVHKLLLKCCLFTEELNNLHVHAMQVCGSWSMRCNYELVNLESGND